MFARLFWHLCFTSGPVTLALGPPFSAWQHWSPLLLPLPFSTSCPRIGRRAMATEGSPPPPREDPLQKAWSHLQQKGQRFLIQQMSRRMLWGKSTQNLHQKPSALAPSTFSLPHTSSSTSASSLHSPSPRIAQFKEASMVARAASCSV